MDFNVKRFAAEAATAFSRAVQYTEEKLGTCEKTELDAHFENLAQRADRTKLWTEQILERTEAALTPNPNNRVEDFLFEKLERKPRDRLRNLELLGVDMVEGGNDFGPGTAYGSSLIKVGHTQQQLGNVEREFVSKSGRNFLQPLRRFLDGDMKIIMKERKILENKRLDLDACKSRLRKARSMDGQQNIKEGVSVRDIIEQAERDVRMAQSEFDRQAEITKLLLEGVSSAHTNHLRCLNDFVEAQMTYYAQCHQYMTDLQKELASSSMTTAGSAHANSTTPSLFTTPASPNDSDGVLGAATGTKKARVLYDYDAATPGELSLLADEVRMQTSSEPVLGFLRVDETALNVITVYNVAGLDDEWMMAERGAQKGKVPGAYLEMLN